MGAKKLKKILILGLFTATVSAYAESKAECINNENAFNLRMINEFCPHAPDIDKCLSANQTRHAAQFAYCNTLE